MLPESGESLTPYPTGAALSIASTITFRAGQTRASHAVLPLGAGESVAVFCGIPSGSVHLALDVTDLQ
jgi:H+/gluconate symporter-like permease